MEQAVNSILRQSYKNLEIIVIDDGSQDKTLEKLYSFSDSRIKVYSNRYNLGYLQTVNSAFDLCSGKYIGFQDADDVSHPERIESQVRALENNSGASVALTQCIYQMAGKEAKKTASSFPAKKIEAVKKLLSGETKIFCGASIVVKRAALLRVGKFRLLFDRVGAEHVDWFFRALRTEDFVTIDRPLYIYKIHPNSFSRTLSENPLKFHSLQLALLSFIVFHETGVDPLSDDELTNIITSSIVEPYFKDKGRFKYAIGLNHLRNENSLAAIQTTLDCFLEGRVYLGLKLFLTSVFYLGILKWLPEQFTRTIISKRNLIFVRKIRLLINSNSGRYL